jgi:HK97 family phage portal protein
MAFRRTRAIFNAAVRRAILSPVSTALSNILYPLGYVREGRPGDWQLGVSTAPMSDLTANGAVFACLYRITSDIGKLEVCLQQRDPTDGMWREANWMSPFWRVLDKPNDYQNIIQFVVYWIASKLVYGNTYGLKVREEARGMVKKIHILDPRNCRPLIAPDGGVYYQISASPLYDVPDSITVPASEIVHDRGMTLWHPLVGVSPIYACAVSATQGKLIQNNSQKFFHNMSRPSGMLTSDLEISQPTADRLKADWEKNYSGANIGKLAVLGNGLKYEAMTIPPETAQLVEQLDWTAVDIARCFLVPLYKINAGPIPAGMNVEAMELQYFSGCLQQLVQSFERCMTEGLELPVGMKVELDEESLLRMDSASHIKMLADAVRGTIMAPNEARAKRNLPAKPGGDSLYLQEQNYSLEALAKRDAREDPFAKGPAAPAPGASATPAKPDPEDPEDDTAEEDATAAEDKAAHDIVRKLCERLSAEALIPEPESTGV